MGRQDGDALPRRRFSSAADSRDAETVDTVWSSFFGINALADTKTLTGEQSNLYVVCMYHSVLKRKKKLSVEPSVTFDVIKICLPLYHLKPMYSLMFLTESAR